jgi:hypothetical protein
VARRKATANNGVNNYTEVLSATDTCGGDLTDATCPTGYCHLGGARISDRDAYGAGLVNVANPNPDRVEGAGPWPAPPPFPG